MKETLKEAARDMAYNLIKVRGKTTLTKRELKYLGIDFEETKVNFKTVKVIRKKLKLSQSLFARLIGVSDATVKSWEIKQKNPSGPARVLIEQLKENPHLLDGRLKLLKV